VYTHDTEWDETKKYILDHIVMLRNDPNFADAYFIMQLESNLAYESDHYREYLTQNRMRNLVYMEECSNKSRAGFTTTRATKDQMQLILNDRITNQGLQFYDNLHTTEDDADAMKRLLFRQLENYSSVLNKSTGKRSFSGKVGNEQDDLCMVLQMNCMYRNVFKADVDHKYEQYHRHWRA
jgi:hypothetical protein